MFYDPRGQMIRTENPDGSEVLVVFGIPDKLNNPNVYQPTPWEIYTYEENDNAGRSHPADSQSYQGHWNTPTSAEVDALGRTIKAVERNGPDANTEWYVTQSTYDIRGNLLTVTDALGRLAFQHVYDLADNNLRIDSIDAGLRRIVLGVLGNEVERRDSKGALILQSQDELNRPIRMWARDNAAEAVTLRERLIYSDAPDSGLAATQAAAANLRGELYQHYDEAGRVTFESFDFKGNLLEKVREVINDRSILSVFDSPPSDWQIMPFRIDWNPPVNTTLQAHAQDLLDPTEYRTSSQFDALDRLKTFQYPKDVDGQRRELRPLYNRAGALESVTLDGATYVEHIAYSVKGQRTLIAYGNGVMTRHTYDPQTFRLARLRTERYSKPNAHTYHPQGAAMQDFGYSYDVNGNITSISDRTPESGIPNSPLGQDKLDRKFTYDPINRLLSATGREHAINPPSPLWIDQVKTQDVNQTRAYTESYGYDRLGNIKKLNHQANGGSFVRAFTLMPGNNRLSNVTVGQNPYAYTHDDNGNLVKETDSRHCEWDHSDQMRVFRTQIGNSQPSVHAHYLYDADGQRVKKLVRKQGGDYEATIYIDDVFEHHRWKSFGESAKQNNHLHVMDDQQRIALVRIGDPHPDDKGPAVQYHLGDHLGSSNLVIDDSGA